MTRQRIYIAAIVFIAGNAFSVHSHAQDNNFDKDRDLLVCQFDNLPDTDDIYAQAALAGFLAHPDQEGVNYFCAAGAWGTQIDNSGFDYDDTQELMNLGFGREAVRGDSASERAESRWVTSHGEIIYGEVRDGVVRRSQERIENLDFASDVIAAKAKPVLEAGGRVFVAEAGQSDLTADWVEKLVADGVEDTQDNIIVIQHSSFNRVNTAGSRRVYEDGNDDLGFLSNGEVSTFRNIADGNVENNTPAFRDTNTTFLREALSDNNPSSYTRAIWSVASRLAEESTYQSNGGTIRDGGVDFSDHVEVLHIFDLSDESAGFHTVRAYWNEYVLNSSITQTPGGGGPVTPLPPVTPDPPTITPDPPTITPDPPTSLGLVAYWAFDETSGQTIVDSSGNNNDGSLINGTRDSSGVQGGALTFEGGNEGIEIPASAFDTIDDEITVSMWVNGASNQPVADTVFRALDSSGNRVLNIHVPWSDSKVYWDAGNSGSSYDRLSESADASLYEGGYNHWAFTKNAGTGVISMYVNGTLFASDDDHTFDMSGISSVVLGGDESAGYNGSIDEVRVYDEVLSPTEIMNLFQEISVVTPTGGGDDGTGDGDIGTRFDGDGYDAESDPGNNRLVRDIPPTTVGYLMDGTWIRFDDFDFGSGASTVEFSASSGRAGGTIEVRLGSPTGELVATVDVPRTGSFLSFQSFEADVGSAATGVQDLYLVSTGDSGTFLYDIENFEFN